MRSHIVTCHLAAVTFLSSPLPNLVLDFATRRIQGWVELGGSSPAKDSAAISEINRQCDGGNRTRLTSSGTSAWQPLDRGNDSRPAHMVHTANDWSAENSIRSKSTWQRIAQACTTMRCQYLHAEQLSENDAVLSQCFHLSVTTGLPTALT